MGESASELIQAIETLVSEFHWKGIKFIVFSTSVHYENGWWQVALRPNQWPDRVFPIIEEIGILADRLEDERHFKIIFSLGNPLSADHDMLEA